MKNNKGFGKFEVLTVIVLLLVVFAFIAYKFLGGASSQKLDTMKESAVSFSKAVTVNHNTFHNTENIYLGEVIDEQLIKPIKNPLGKGNCSESESVVHMRNGLPYVTLRCGDYLIDGESISSKKDVDIYKVSNWSEKKTNDDDEEKTFYNCVDNGKEVFDEYYEDLYFVYQINKKYQTSYFFISHVSKTCEVKEKKMYRTKSLFELD